MSGVRVPHCPPAIITKTIDLMAPTQKKFRGRILVIGPSRSGKTFLTRILREHGLPVVDADKETGLIAWRSDADGKKVTTFPSEPSADWFKVHHFLMDMDALAVYLTDHTDVIFLAHCWNIMDCVGLFDEVYFMYVPPAELARRMKNQRRDHLWQGSKAEVDFMLERHRERRVQAEAMGIPLLDMSQPSQQVMQELLKQHEERSGLKPGR